MHNSLPAYLAMFSKMASKTALTMPLTMSLTTYLTTQTETSSASSTFLGRTQSLVTRVALSLLVMLSGVMSAHAADEILLDKIVAIVDDDIVMQSELDSRVNSVMNRLSRQGTAMPPRTIMDERVLEQLILESIQLQMAERSGIRINDDQLNKALANIAQANNMTLEQFEAQLALEGDSYANAREQIRREMIISRVQQRQVTSRVRVTDQEVDNFLASKEGREKSGLEYKIGHILISVPESASEAERAQAKARAERVLESLQNGADFQQTAIAESDGRRALDGGVIGWRKENELPSIAADILPSLGVGQPSALIPSGSGFHIITALEKRGGGTQIVDQYRVRHILISPNEIRTEAQAKEIIDKLAERIEDGDDFAVLAKSNSDDPVSAIDGGDLSWVNLGQMVPEFEQKMLSTPVGQLSKPFKSNFGWHILEVLETRKQDVGAMLQANQARQVIQRRKYEEELAIWLQEIKGEAFIEFKDERFSNILEQRT